MLFLILFVVCIAVGFVLVRQLDRRRWHRYQIERDLYFHQYPYILDGEQTFAVHLSVSGNMQRKLINTLMLVTQDQCILKKMFIQREAEQKNQPFLVQVMFHDLKIGYLESTYAERLCKVLQDTDFIIGRPIEIMTELQLYPSKNMDLACKIRLDLPKDLTLVTGMMKEKKASSK